MHRKAPKIETQKFPMQGDSIHSGILVNSIPILKNSSNIGSLLEPHVKWLQGTLIAVKTLNTKRTT